MESTTYEIKSSAIGQREKFGFVLMENVLDHCVYTIIRILIILFTSIVLRMLMIYKCVFCVIEIG
jgi:hypothetical protein